MQRHIVVVGAGIIGAAIALNLLRGGARVTLLDAAEPGGVATRQSWAWINASWFNPHPYFSLRVRSMQEWRELERTVPGLRVGWVGGLVWDLPEDRLRAFVAQHAAWGYAIRLIDGAAVAELEPALAAVPAFAAHAPDEGVVEPLETVHALLAEVARLGGRILAQTPARALAASGGRVTGVRTDSGTIAADEIVVAAGLGSGPLLGSVGYPLPLDASPSLRVVSRPQGPLLQRLIVTPTAEIRQDGQGRLIACAAFAGGDEAEAAAALEADVQSTFATALAWESHVVARRPMPRDGFSLVGRRAGLEGLYVAATHSGITLAPAIGRFAADEILHGRRDPLLQPFGLGRFDGV